MNSIVIKFFSQCFDSSMPGTIFKSYKSSVCSGSMIKTSVGLGGSSLGGLGGSSLGGLGGGDPTEDVCEQVSSSSSSEFSSKNINSLARMN